MKKAGIVVLVVLLVAVIGLIFVRDAMIERAVEAAGKRSLQVETEVGGVSSKPFSGRLRLSDVEIANPPGFDSPYFARLGSGAASVETTSLLGDMVEIRTLELENFQLYLERGKDGTNFGRILESLKRFQKDEKKGEEKTAKRFKIGELVLRDIRIDAHMLPALGSLADTQLAIGELRLKDLGGEDGITLSQIIAVTMEAVMASAVKVGGGVLPVEMLRDLEGALRELGGDVLEGLTEDLLPTLEKIGGNVGAGAQDAAKKVGKELEKIFKP